MLAQITVSERPIGNQPRPAQKKISITMPNQNVGMLAPLTDRTRVTWSGHRSRRRAANVPIEIPSAIAIRPARAASSVVAVSLSTNTSDTGAFDTADQPSSPWKTPLTQARYCTGSGSSSPNRASTRSISSGDIPGSM